MSETFLGTVIQGPNTFRGEVMTRNLVSPTLQSELAQMGSKLGKEIGAKVADRLTSFKAKQSTANPPPLRPSTHLDVVDDYMANHALYASDGETLYDRVHNYFVNDPQAPEPTDGILSAVRVKSDQLHEKWLSGEVEDPYARKQTEGVA